MEGQVLPTLCSLPGASDLFPPALQQGQRGPGHTALRGRARAGTGLCLATERDQGRPGLETPAGRVQGPGRDSCTLTWGT